LKNQRNYNLRNRQEREAINAPIQGTAADIMKLAMVRVPEALVKAKLAARIILQVHDELVLECPQSELNQTSDVVQETMENVYSLKVPLLTDARFGTKWGQMSPVS
jgi:DNA polymerase-1